MQSYYALSLIVEAGLFIRIINALNLYILLVTLFKPVQILNNLVSSL